MKTLQHLLCIGNMRESGIKVKQKIGIV